MAKLSPPPLRSPFLDGEKVSREWARFFNHISRQADTQADGADAVGNPPTQTEFNALVSVVNALIDKLQAVGLME